MSALSHGPDSRSWRAALAGAFGASLVLTSASLAYILDGDVWPNARATYKISLTSFPQGSPEQAQIQQAFEDWNGLSGCAFTFTHAPSSSSGAADHSDRNNGVAFSSQVSGGTLGVTYSTDSGGERLSADVLFNNQSSWSYDGSPSQNQWDLGSTARHELGHALGLDHSDHGCQALMGRSCGTNGIVRRIMSDDAAGARDLYPQSMAPAARPNLRARLTGPASARPGQVVSVELTIENAGAGPASTLPSRHFVLSTNAWISDQDRDLGTAAGSAQTLGAGRSATIVYQVTVPSTTTPGAYWLGARIDPAGDLEETDEDDNTASFQLVVTSGATSSTTSTGPSTTTSSTSSPNAPAPANWAFTAFSATPQALQAGGSLTVSWTLRNSGAASPATPALRVVLSDNASFTTRDLTLREVAEQAAPVAKDGVVTGTATITLPAVTEGAWFVGVIADPLDASVEASEDDNTRGEPLTVLATTTAAPAPAPTPAPSPVVSAPAAAPVATTPATTTTPAATTAPAATASPKASTASAATSGGGGGGGCAIAPAPGAAPSLAPLLGALGLLLGLRRRAAR